MNITHTQKKNRNTTNTTTSHQVTATQHNLPNTHTHTRQHNTNTQNRNNTLPTYTMTGAQHMRELNKTSEWNLVMRKAQGETETLYFFNLWSTVSVVDTLEE